MPENGFNRIFLTVLDSFGVGEAPDAARFGDQGADTLGNVLKVVTDTKLPNLEKLGLGNIGTYRGLPPNPNLTGIAGKMAELSDGKDTITGHWEMMGLVIDHGFPLYPNGFPRELMEQFEREIGRKWLGNRPASGTDIIKELGPEHERTGAVIVYTSGDSVFQVAAHEDIVPIDELYRICEVARRLCVYPFNVARIIARPFTGKHPHYERTPRRHDYAVSPPEKTLLDFLAQGGVSTYGIGKISDIFNAQGVQHSARTNDNLDGMNVLLKHIQEVPAGSFVFTNLVDFDSKYGHRNDAIGYSRALMEYDAYLPRLLAAMRPTDLFLMTADHGCDPTDVSTDHTREYVPILGWSPSFAHGRELGIRDSFNDLGRTIADLYGVNVLSRGRSFADEIVRGCRS
jgi:phosphopentomutase